MASVWVPFTSESKEAIADYDEIRKEMKLALMECGRKLGAYLRKRQRMRREGERRDVFERYIGEIAKAINDITGEDARKVYDALLKQAKARTAVADQVLDEDGKVTRDDPAEVEGVIVVPEAIAPVGGAPAAAAAPADVPEAPARRRRKRETKPDPARAELRARAAKAAARRPGKGGGPDLF
jgi:DNA topoisomerase-6 subunit B